MATTKTLFNRYAANIAEDNAIAVYDILPSDDIAQTDGTGDYINGYTSVPEIDWIETDPGVSDPRFFPIESSHTLRTLTGYYINRKGTKFVDFPDSRGIPLNYGGAPRVRFRAIEDDIVGSEPIMVIPSGGMCSNYPDRARSFEMWVNMEPYSQAKSFNLFPDSIFYMDDFVTADVITEMIADRYPAPNPLVRSWNFSDGAEATFTDGMVLSGGIDYKLYLAVYNPNAESTVTITLTIPVGGDIKDYVFEHTLPLSAQFDPTFTNQFATGWKLTSLDLSIDGTIDRSKAQLTVSVAGGNVGIASPILYSLNSDVPVTIVSEESFVEFGGPDGTVVKLTADSDFLHLYGYGRIDSYQIGEWARPMYLVFVDNDTSFDVYLDSNIILSIDKIHDATYGPVHGEWIQISISESFKYIDLSTMALYSTMLNSDIQKLHRLFGYGPSYHDSINMTQNDGVYVADGSNTEFSSAVLFPQTMPFSIGSAHGLEVQNELYLPEFRYPPLINGNYADMQFHTNLYGGGYQLESFSLPTDSEMQFRMKEIDTEVSYIMLGVYPEGAAGTICSVYSNTLGYSIHFTYSEDPDDISKYNIRAISTYSSTKLTYDQYALLYSKYLSDPNYLKAPYLDLTGIGLPWYDEQYDKSGFLVVLNMNELRQNSDTDVAALFSDDDLVLRIDDSSKYTHIGYATRSSVLSGGVLNEGETDFPGMFVEPVDDNGLYNRKIIGNLTQVLYTHNGILDISSLGEWKVDIPLTNFASFVNGVPDLDFITYSDNRQSPQLVTSFTRDIMSYEELERVVVNQYEPLVADNTASYDDLQASTDPDQNYVDVGVQIDTSEPAMSRFAHPTIETFVSLNSPVRWPNKDIGSHKIERATMNGFVDFENSPNSVLDTKWEIFDGWAIRIPKGINLHYYSLSFEVRITTRSLLNRKPTFRRADFFGVASGDSPSNQINLGTGKSIVIGNDDDINLNKPFSTHLVTENLPVNVLTRELGFYPHIDLANNVLSPIHFYLGESNKVCGISFYINWRCESFKESGTDLIARIRHTDTTDTFTDLSITTQPVPLFADLAAGSFDVYVDGVLSTEIEAGRWHSVFIDLTDENGNITFGGSKVIRFTLYNNKSVVNYLTSHSTNIDPSNLYASRFGMSDQDVFIDSFDTALHFGTDPTQTFPATQDDSTVIYFERISEGGFLPEPTNVITASLGSNTVL